MEKDRIVARLSLTVTSGDEADMTIVGDRVALGGALSTMMIENPSVYTFVSLAVKAAELAATQRSCALNMPIENN